MRCPRATMDVRRLMALVAIVALLFAVADAVKVGAMAERCRRQADWCERMERRCREIDAMDAATRAREAEAAYDDPYLDNPTWNREMIPYFAGLKRTLRQAALRPRDPIPALSPNP